MPSRPIPVKIPFNTVSNVSLLLVVAILSIALCARLLPGPRTIDDAFITFRYARNLLAGDGFVYNPGERVLGTTTPLYTLLLVLLGALTGGVHAPFHLLALGINALSDALTCLLLIGLGRRLKAPRAGLAAAFVWAVAPFSVTFAIGGLETSLYVLLLVAAASAHLHRRRLPAALFGALSLLARPDALILLGPLVVDRAWQVLQDWTRSRGPGKLGDAGGTANLPAPIPAGPLVKELLVFSLPVLAWLVFATVHFGSPLPHSIAAKTLAYHLPREAALVRLLQHYATPFLEHLTFGLPAIAAGLVLYPFLSILGAHRALRNDPHAWPILAYPWLYFATFALANPLIFRWYLTPPLPFYILGILMGVEAFGATLGRGRLRKKKSSSPFGPFSAKDEKNEGAGERPGRSPAGVVIPLVLALPLALTLRGWELRPDHGLTRPAPGMAWYELELLYRQAAETLAPELGPSPGERVLAAGDVGVLGFFTGARILDTVGLNSPVSTQYYPLDPDLYTINYAVPPALILDQQPDFIVILEIYGRKGLLQESRFWAAYDLLHALPTNVYGSNGMLIFQRRP